MTTRHDSPAFGRDVTLLSGAGREFVRHPSPWIIATLLVGALSARVALGHWTWADALVPAIMLALFPVLEWIIHVFVLHWRPRRSPGSPSTHCSPANTAPTTGIHGTFRWTSSPHRCSCGWYRCCSRSHCS